MSDDIVVSDKRIQFLSLILAYVAGDSFFDGADVIYGNVARRAIEMLERMRLEEVADLWAGQIAEENANRTVDKIIEGMRSGT